ncbi:MAG TPA: hypothetical protein VFG79_21685 [Solirubrobacter sp.]|nr:hypothetical protein [Solirubrobacter sp.]
MEGTTLTRPHPGTTSPRPRPSLWDRGDRLAKPAFALLCLGFAIGFFVYPTYPVYDSYYSLLWGRDLLHGDPLVFEGFRYPTEHPLAIAAGAVLQLFGRGGDRLWIAFSLAAFLALVAGVYRLGRLAATPLVGAVAAALLLTRFDFAFLAARGYIDVPYMALIVWAATLEARRPRRGAPVLVLLALAGTLRPEAWFMSGLYFLWVAWRASWRQRIGFAALAALGPATWALTDFAVTGNPLFSQQYTSSSAEDLGRQGTLSDLPSVIPDFFRNLVKLPVLAAAAAGLVLGVVISPRRMLMPLVLFVVAVGTFVAISAAGASVIERYLAIAAVALMVFAAVAVGGWTMLAPGRLRLAWQVVAAAVALYGVIFTVTHLDLSRLDQELTFRGEAHDDLVAVLDDPRVKAGLRCGPLSVPNHKLVPDSRWVAGLGDGAVRARAERFHDAAARPRRGVALVVTSRFAVVRQAWTDDSDDPRIQLPPPGFERVKTTRFYGAYVRC